MYVFLMSLLTHSVYAFCFFTFFHLTISPGNHSIISSWRSFLFLFTAAR